MRSIYGIFKRNDINVTIYDPVALDRAASGEWRVAILPKFHIARLAQTRSPRGADYSSGS